MFAGHRQVAEAARVAQRHGDLALSLLLTQLTGSHEVRQLARAQLTSWRQVSALPQRLLVLSSTGR